MRSPLSSPRPVVGLAVGGVLVAALAVLLAPWHEGTSRVTLALLLLVPVMLASVLGGRIAAFATAVLAALSFALYLPPVGSPRVDLESDAVALVVFVVVTGGVGGIVATALAAERRRRAADVERVASLEAIDRQRSMLMRSVSHDLRTPLSTIRAVATELRNDEMYAPETRDELLALAIDEVDRLDRIVGNLLGLSRVEAGALRPDARVVEVDEVVARSAERLAHLARRVSLHVDLGADGTLVRADPTHLDQVVANLVENAVRVSRPESVVTLSTRIEADRVEVAVTDDGPGLPSALRDRLFEPYAADAPAGAGVGLAVCRALVEANGGTITGGDGPAGRGARFSVMLPVHVERLGADRR